MQKLSISFLRFSNLFQDIPTYPYLSFIQIRIRYKDWLRNLKWHRTTSLSFRLLLPQRHSETQHKKPNADAGHEKWTYRIGWTRLMRLSALTVGSHKLTMPPCGWQNEVSPHCNKKFNAPSAQWLQKSSKNVFWLPKPHIWFRYQSSDFAGIAGRNRQNTENYIIYWFTRKLHHW